MLKERLLTSKFYLDNLSLFMKNSYGIKDRLDTYLSILNNINNISDDIISRFDIYNIIFTDNYFIRNNINETGTDDEWLDLIGSIFNIKRTMKITYVGADVHETGTATPENNWAEDDYPYGQLNRTYTQTITLTNYEMFMYIKFMIIKLNYRGINQDILNAYSGNTNDRYNLAYFNIHYYWIDSLNCNVYLDQAQEIPQNNYSNNLIKLFLGDKFIIESLGIQYHKRLIMDNLAQFVDPEQTLEGQSKFYQYSDSKNWIFS